MWIGFLIGFTMFFYQYNFVYYKKGILEDNAQYKSIYNTMRKTSRKLAIAFVFFSIITGCLFLEVFEGFTTCLLKGGVLAAVLFPLMNGYFGDETRFRFSF